MPKLPLMSHPSITSGNSAKCRRSVAYRAAAAPSCWIGNDRRIATRRRGLPGVTRRGGARRIAARWRGLPSFLGRGRTAREGNVAPFGRDFGFRDVETVFLRLFLQL